MNRTSCCFSCSNSIAAVLLGTEYMIVSSLNLGSDILSIDAILYLPLSSCLSTYSFHVSEISLWVIFFSRLYSASSIFDEISVKSLSFSILFSDRVDVSKSARFISAIGFDFFWTFIFEWWDLKTWLWNDEIGINLYLIFFFCRLIHVMRFLI